MAPRPGLARRRMPSRRLLQILRLPATASSHELRQRYLERVKSMHPDVCTQASATENFAELQVCL